MIALCGVHFMAETAAILCPEKTVLIPDPQGRLLARRLDRRRGSCGPGRPQHPGAVVVSYVNTTAEVKAESDYCCTSGNARAVIESIPADREILFLPDLYLGLWLERVTGRKLRIWLGECHVHAGIRPADIERWQREAPDAELLVHPECGCASQAMAFAQRAHAHPLDRGDDRASRAARRAQRFVVATETGILHRLERRAAREALRGRPGGGGLPVHEDDHAREAARLPARPPPRGRASTRELAARARRCDRAHGRDRLSVGARRCRVPPARR